MSSKPLGPFFLGDVVDSAGRQLDDAAFLTTGSPEGQEPEDGEIEIRAPRAKEIGHLIVAAPDLLAALKIARECIAYCRKNHKDVQSGEGFPVEIILDSAIAKAEGATR